MYLSQIVGDRGDVSFFGVEGYGSMEGKPLTLINATYFYYYRVSSKVVYAFLLTISQLLVGLGLKCWTFFNSPVYVDNKTDLNFIPRCFLGRDI